MTDPSPFFGAMPIPRARARPASSAFFTTPPLTLPVTTETPAGTQYELFPEVAETRRPIAQPLHPSAPSSPPRGVQLSLFGPPKAGRRRLRPHPVPMPPMPDARIEKPAAFETPLPQELEQRFDRFRRRALADIKQRMADGLPREEAVEIYGGQLARHRNKLQRIADRERKQWLASTKIGREHAATWFNLKELQEAQRDQAIRDGATPAELEKLAAEHKAQRATLGKNLRYEREIMRPNSSELTGRGVRGTPLPSWFTPSPTKDEVDALRSEHLEPLKGDKTGPPDNAVLVTKTAEVRKREALAAEAALKKAILDTDNPSRTGLDLITSRWGLTDSRGNPRSSFSLRELEGTPWAAISGDRKPRPNALTALHYLPRDVEYRVNVRRPASIDLASMRAIDARSAFGTQLTLNSDGNLSASFHVLRHNPISGRSLVDLPPISRPTPPWLLEKQKQPSERIPAPLQSRLREQLSTEGTVRDIPEHELDEGVSSFLHEEEVNRDFRSAKARARADARKRAHSRGQTLARVRETQKVLRSRLTSPESILELTSGPRAPFRLATPLDMTIEQRVLSTLLNDKDLRGSIEATLRARAAASPTNSPRPLTLDQLVGYAKKRRPDLLEKLHRNLANNKHGLVAFLESLSDDGLERARRIIRPGTISRLFPDGKTSAWRSILMSHLEPNQLLFEHLTTLDARRARLRLPRTATVKEVFGDQPNWSAMTADFSRMKKGIKPNTTIEQLFSVLENDFGRYPTRTPLAALSSSPVGNEPTMGIRTRAASLLSSRPTPRKPTPSAATQEAVNDYFNLLREGRWDPQSYPETAALVGDHVMNPQQERAAMHLWNEIRKVDDFSNRRVVAARKYARSIGVPRNLLSLIGMVVAPMAISMGLAWGVNHAAERTA